MSAKSEIGVERLERGTRKSHSTLPNEESLDLEGRLAQIDQDLADVQPRARAARETLSAKRHELLEAEQTSRALDAEEDRLTRQRDRLSLALASKAERPRSTWPRCAPPSRHGSTGP